MKNKTMTKTLIIFLFAIALVTNVAAQNVYDSKWIEDPERREKVMDSLNDVIDSRLQTLKRLSSETSKAVALLKEKEMLLDSVEHIREDIALLISQQKELKKTSDSLKGFQEFGERCLCEYIQGKLSQPYPKIQNRINTDTNSYYNLRSAQLREEFKPLLTLLRGYETYYEDFMGVIRSAQNDISRMSVERKEEYSSKYILRIQQMPYYQKYYGKDWSILYLDYQIDKALKLLEKHNSGGRSKKFIVDFSYLLCGQ